jgi:hypothetical protein
MMSETSLEWRTVMPRIRTEISDDQLRHARGPDEWDSVIERVVVRAVAHLENRMIPTRQRALRREAAARYVGVDSTTLQDWAGEKPPKGPAFRRLGGRVIYLIEELDEYLNSLPKNTPHHASKAVANV